MRSMTGFGRGLTVTDMFRCVVEIKTVNSRFADFTIRMPRQLNCIEDKLRSEVRRSVQRGKIDLSITLTETGSREKRIIVNDSLCKQIKAFLVTEGFFPSLQEVTLEAVMAVSEEWLRLDEDEADEQTLTETVLPTLQAALEGLAKMRDREGENLRLDLIERGKELSRLIEEIDSRKETSLHAYEGRLKKRIGELLTGTDPSSVNEERLLQEVAIMADKSDITEEIVRFRSHVVQLNNILDETEPVGRKMDFLLQEMNREVNTIGSKSTDLAVTAQVVQLKCELEKIREQIQNIE